MSHRKVRLWLTHPPLLGVNALEQRAAIDPVGLLEECRDRHRAGGIGDRLAGWENTVACYASAMSIRNNAALWEQLLASPFFRFRQYDPKREDVLRFAILVGTNAAVTGLSYQQGCYKERILRPFFDVSTTPRDLLEKIRKAKGLAGLVKKRATSKPEHAPEPAPQSGATRPVNKAGTVAPNANDESRRPTLEIEMPETMLREVLAVEPICRTMLMIEHYQTERGWQRIRAISYKLVNPKN